MWPFKSSKHGQSPAQLRAEVEALRKRVVEAEQGDADRTEERDFFHAAWKEVGQRAMDAETVVECLEAEVAELHARIAELEGVVADLEKIAGPHVPAKDGDDRIYAALRASETTQEIAVKSLADAVGAGAR